MKRFLPIIIIGIALLMLISGCSKEEEELPAIPNSGILTMELAPFTTTQTLRPETRCADFDTAASLVTFWSVVVNVYFLVPRLAFHWALSQPAESDGHRAWRWDLTVNANLSLTLKARAVAGDSVEWKMFVTNIEEGWDDFMWYSGKCDFGATGGWWQFYDPDLPLPSNQYIWAGWERSPADTTGKLTLVNVRETHEGFGDTIYYELNGTSAYAWLRDADSPRPGRWEIWWDIVDYEGKIKYPEGAEKCWDSALECCACP